MNLVDFVTWVKRESRYGGSPVITGAAAANDQPTLDILTSLNARRNRIWRKPANWPWFVEQIQFACVPGTVKYAVTTVSGNKIDRIQNLYQLDTTVTPNVYGFPFKQRTVRQFAQDMALNRLPKECAGIYKNLGQVGGVWQIEIGLGPSSAFTMAGDAKGLLNTFLIGDVTGVAPFSAGNVAQAINPNLDYFPTGVIEDILFEGVMGDIKKIQGNEAAGASADLAFEGKIKLLAAEETDAAKDNTPLTRPLPRLIQRRMARRCRRW